MQKIYAYRLTDYQRVTIIDRLYFGARLKLSDYSYTTIKSLTDKGWITTGSDQIALTEAGKAAYTHYLESPNRRYQRVKRMSIDQEHMEKIAEMARAALRRAS